MTVYYADDALTLLLGDAVEQMSTLAAESVHCVVTSPPYYGLRDYGGHPDQIGLEDSPFAYVQRMAEVFRQVHRVLADDGTVWLNLGDSYAYPPGSAGRQGAGQRTGRRFTAEGLRGNAALPPKNLIGIPWRVALALQDAGWVLRSEIIWAKRNIMPESVTDRPTRAHEQIFLLTKGSRYYYDADAIREESNPDQEKHNQRYAREYAAHTVRAATTGQPGNVNSVGIHSRPGVGGRNSRTVWTISSTPLKAAHFATFPVELPRRCIMAGCPAGGTVLDPFSGAGTTALAAQQLGRRAIGIDLVPEYHTIALRRMATAPLPLDGGAA